MTTNHLEVIVEEPSMEIAMRALLPKLLDSISFEVYPHQCKTELLDRLPQRLRGYRSWLPETHRILVLVDRDDDDCVELKRRLESIADAQGLSTKSGNLANTVWSVVNRIVVEELEAWYFGDWDAVRAAYPKVHPTVPNKAAYRNPDRIAGGTWERFERVLQAAGYFRGGLRKLEAARAISPHLVPERNRSASFCTLRKTLEALRDTRGQSRHASGASARANPQVRQTIVRKR